MFICIEIPKHWRLPLFRYKTFINFFWLLVFWHEERVRDNFYNADCSYIALQSTPQLNSQPRIRISTHWPNKRAAHPVDPQTGLALPSFKSQLASPRDKSQLIAFSKITKILSPSLPGMTSFPPPVTFLMWGFYYDICDCHILCARAWTVLNVCTFTKPNQTEW